MMAVRVRESRYKRRCRSGGHESLWYFSELFQMKSQNLRL